MARLTKEQKAAQELLDQEQLEREAAEAYETYITTLPGRILHAMAAAAEVGVSAHTTLGTDGKPETRFEYEDHKRHAYIDRAISHNSDLWEIDILEGELEELRLDKVAQEQRFQIALAATLKLTKEEFEALREFIYAIK
jgi:hypothetical protein